MYICNIVWPEEKEAIMKLLLSFMIEVVDPLNITFPKEINNPLKTAKSFLNGDVSQEDYESMRDLCWKYIDDRDSIREFELTDILFARLGICLSSADKDCDQAGEKLAWFFEVLDYLQIDTSHAETLMQQQFSFSA